MTEKFEVDSWEESLESVIYELDYESQHGTIHGNLFVENLIKAKELLEQALKYINISHKILDDYYNKDERFE
jgi:hypothetical protein